MAGPSTGRTFVLPVIIGMRDLEVVDSELRLLAAVRQVSREQDGILPSIGPVDELLDERRELDRKLTRS
jgi:hypothetical protein